MNQLNKKSGIAQKILNTAFDSLSERGYASVSLRDIAREADVALGQVTYYFKSKEALFLEVINMMITRYLDEVSEKLEAVSGPKKRLAALTNYFIDLTSTAPRLLKLFVDFTAQAMWVPSFQEKLNSLFEKLAELIETQLSFPEKRSENKSGLSSLSMAKIILGTLYGISVQLLLNTNCDVSYELLESLLI